MDLAACLLAPESIAVRRAAGSQKNEYRVTRTATTRARPKID
jgi:hypothetical protein